METKQLSKNEIIKIKNEIHGWLNMYSPIITITQEHDIRVIWYLGEKNERNNIVCKITIDSDKDKFEELIDFHPSLDEKSIARKIVKDFFDAVDKNITGPLANKLWG